MLKVLCPLLPHAIMLIENNTFKSMNSLYPLNIISVLYLAGLGFIKPKNPRVFCACNKNCPAVSSRVQISAKLAPTLCMSTNSQATNVTKSESMQALASR